jgi:hypothetical protein
LLILNKFYSRTFFGESAQALDFSSVEGSAEGSINKVIHNFDAEGVNGFQIKDLPRSSEHHLKSST